MASRTPRDVLLERLAGLITQTRSAQLLRVAVDGPDAAGKTTLAGELADRLAGKRDVIRASTDGFHRPGRSGTAAGTCPRRALTTTRSTTTPSAPSCSTRSGQAAVGVTARPCSTHRRDAPVEPSPRPAPAGAVLLFDGVFLLRPRLRDGWDIALFVDADPGEVLRRVLARDTRLMGGPDRIRERYQRRCLPAQQLYRADAAPEARADVVIDNTDPVRPRVLTWPAQPPETP
jgi:uridine kinase